MSLSTKNVKVGSVSKVFEPGNVTAEILSVALAPFSFREGAYHVSLFIQGKEIEGFSGIAVDKTNPEGEKYKGQVAYVKSSDFAYSDGTTKKGVSISRDHEILKFVKTLCVESGPSAVKWFDDQDNKHETIESFMEAFDTDKPFKNVMFNFCLAGKEYTNKQNYQSYELFLPKTGKGEKAFEKEGADPSKLVIFDPEKHLKKPAAKQFKESDTAPAADDSFSL